MRLPTGCARTTTCGPGRLTAHSQTAWVVLDFFDVIVHVMRQDVRERYDLETLWGDAPRVKQRKRAAAKA